MIVKSHFSSGFNSIFFNTHLQELDGEVVEEELTIKERTQRFLQNTSRESAGRAAAILASQPFHVIAVRCMAEFVGSEEKYT